MIKTVFLPALVLAAASVAVPAMAQSYGPARQSGLTISFGTSPAYGYNSGYNRSYNQSGWQAINRRQATLDRRIDLGVRNGSLTRREAVSLRREFNNIARLESQYRRNGLTRREMADLDRRFDRLSRQIRIERNDRQTRNSRYDRNDRHDRHDRYDRNDRNGRRH
ncbi:hypothetical protein [uncultured Brevundimonas sp.]|uniref:hypothetical protein n=1 Tax=uncultured Brevundimonas sp. TaxID=213418 RepID=UPI0030EF2E75|tara:strand:+ start:207 stop:701 length:495 start_codon:yes stop_codon:yes gene_type:complete